MRIGILSAANSIHTVKIANGLAALGHEVTVISLPNHRDVDHALTPEVRLEYLQQGGVKGYFLNYYCLKKSIRRYGIEVLNAHYASGYGTLASLVSFHPYVLSVWGSDVYEFPDKSLLHRWLIRRNLAKADRILSTSYIMAERTKLLISGKPIAVTPFGIDTEVFSPIAIGTGILDGVTIGIVKTIAPKYGIRELILAFNKVLKALPNRCIRLSIYGDGVQRQEMVQLTQELGLTELVRFHGRIPHSQVPDVLHTFDVFCAPSTSNSESFGVAAVEAMACGIPCITSDADGFTEVMEDGVTGYVVPKNDVDSLADKLVVLIQDETLRARMGRSGRTRVLEYYDWNQNILNIEDQLVHIEGTKR